MARVGPARCWVPAAQVQGDLRDVHTPGWWVGLNMETGPQRWGAGGGRGAPEGDQEGTVREGRGEPENRRQGVPRTVRQSARAAATHCVVLTTLPAGSRVCGKRTDHGPVLSAGT